MMLNPDDAADGHLRAVPERDVITYRTRFKVSHIEFRDEEADVYFIELEGLSALVVTMPTTMAEDFVLDSVWTGKTELEYA